MSRLLANLGWTAPLIPLLYIAHVVSPKDHYGDTVYLGFLIILGLPLVFLTTISGLILLKRQTRWSRWLLVVNLVFLLYSLLPLTGTVTFETVRPVP